MASLARETRIPPAEPARAEERQEQLADFEALYLEHVELVRRVVARLLGPDGAIEDAIQEVFLVAFRKRASFAGRARPSTWLYAIAQRVAFSSRRKARVKSWLGLDAAPELTDRVTPASVFEQREAAAELYRLLDQIADKKRTVWILYELEELPGEAIATIVGCPIKTVWTRLYHARRELQQLARGLADRSDP